MFYYGFRNRTYFLSNHLVLRHAQVGLRHEYSLRAFDVNMQYGRAELLDRQYGAMLRRPPLSDLASAYHLHRALEAKGIDVTA